MRMPEWHGTCPKREWEQNAAIFSLCRGQEVNEACRSILQIPCLIAVKFQGPGPSITIQFADFLKLDDFTFSPCLYILVVKVSRSLDDAI